MTLASLKLIWTTTLLKCLQRAHTYCMGKVLACWVAERELLVRGMVPIAAAPGVEEAMVEVKKVVNHW